MYSLRQTCCTCLLEILLTAHVPALQALLTVNDESMYMKMNLANQMMASRGLVPQGRWLGYMMTAHMLEGDLAVSPRPLLRCPAGGLCLQLRFH